MSEIININVIIADRPYPLKIQKDEESCVRNAVKLIKDKMMEMQKTYASSDKLDYLAMTALTISVSLQQIQGNDSLSTYEKLSQLDAALLLFLERM